jgi:mono/diheme cytochrome c family protein
MMLVSAVAVAAGCQQKMADQPAPRPYEQTPFFDNTQSARPLEKGTVYRGKPLGDEPMGDWLTAEGRKGPAGTRFDGASAYDPANTVPPVGAPSKDPRSGKAEDKQFVDEFPFEMTAADLKRGQSLYNANCALCHGAAGYANGKIVERGVLRPPSYHRLGEGVKDWSTLGGDGKPKYTAMPAGYSRGYYRWGIEIPLKDVPVGYIYQVITWGYGAMAAHETQLPFPADRWRVVAYLRTLQLSQAVPEAELSAEVKQQISQAAAAAAGGAH